MRLIAVRLIAVAHVQRVNVIVPTIVAWLIIMPSTAAGPRIGQYELHGHAEREPGLRVRLAHPAGEHEWVGEGVTG